MSGLRKDDIIIDDDPVVQEALTRLPKDEYRNRIKRIIRAHEANGKKAAVPEEFRDPDPMKPYLRNIVEEVRQEKMEFDAINNY